MINIILSAVMSVTPVPVADILDTAGEILTEEISWIGKVVQCVTTQPLLLLFTCMAIGATAIGFFNRLRS